MVHVLENFQKKFYNRYYDREIFCKNPRVFKRELMGKLNEIAPYYKQLYFTELESKNIKFLLNKDLTETFIKDVSSNTETSSNTSLNNRSSSSTTGSQNNINNFKESNLDNGNADLGLSQGNLTSVNETSDNTTSNNTTSSNDNSDMNNTGNTSNKENETTTLISQGNIGVTSSAELLKQWREVLINIDNMIIEECRDLFMTIY